MAYEVPKCPWLQDRYVLWLIARSMLGDQEATHTLSRIKWDVPFKSNPA